MLWAVMIVEAVYGFFNEINQCIVSYWPNLQAISVGYASLGIPSSALKI